MPLLYEYRDLFGKPGEGIHRIRIPGTTTAATDYLVTLLLAWFISAIAKTPLVTTTMGLFVLGMVCHWTFGVELTAQTRHM